MNDDFDQRLHQIAPRDVPPAWRKEILAATQSAEISRPQSAPARRHLLSRFIDQLAALSRPQRVAWATLTGAWFIICTLHLTAQEHAATTAQATAPPSPEMLQALNQQKRLLAELTDRSTPNVPHRDKITPAPIPPSPRSERREETITV